MDQVFRDSINRILLEDKLPKIAVMALECSPVLNDKVMRRRAECAIDVLEISVNDEYLKEAMTFSTFALLDLFGCANRLSVEMAYGIVKDLHSGIDVFNPSAADVRKSEVFKIALSYVPDNMSKEEFDREKKKRVEDIIEKYKLH